MMEQITFEKQNSSENSPEEDIKLLRFISRMIRDKHTTFPVFKTFDIKKEKNKLKQIFKLLKERAGNKEIFNNFFAIEEEDGTAKLFYIIKKNSQFSGTAYIAEPVLEKNQNQISFTISTSNL